MLRPLFNFYAFLSPFQMACNSIQLDSLIFFSVLEVSYIISGATLPHRWHFSDCFAHHTNSTTYRDVNDLNPTNEYLDEQPPIVFIEGNDRLPSASITAHLRVSNLHKRIVGQQ
jgi:hypothetical protein